MTSNEFSKAFAIAQHSQGNEIAAMGNIFDGFGLPDFKPVPCTLRQVAGLILWQAQQLNGEWDGKALQSIVFFGRKKFKIIGDDADDLAALKAALAHAE